MYGGYEILLGVSLQYCVRLVDLFSIINAPRQLEIKVERRDKTTSHMKTTVSSWNSIEPLVCPLCCAVAIPYAIEPSHCSSAFWYCHFLCINQLYTVKVPFTCSSVNQAACALTNSSPNPERVLQIVNIALKALPWLVDCLFNWIYWKELELNYSTLLSSSSVNLSITSTWKPSHIFVFVQLGGQSTICMESFSHLTGKISRLFVAFTWLNSLTAGLYYLPEETVLTNTA